MVFNKESLDWLDNEGEKGKITFLESITGALSNFLESPLGIKLW